MYYHAVDTIYPDNIHFFCVILQGQQGTAPLGLVSKVHAKDGGLVIFVAGAFLHLLICSNIMVQVDESQQLIQAHLNTTPNTANNNVT